MAQLTAEIRRWHLKDPSKVSASDFLLELRPPSPELIRDEQEIRKAGAIARKGFWFDLAGFTPPEAAGKGGVK